MHRRDVISVSGTVTTKYYRSETLVTNTATLRLLNEAFCACFAASAARVRLLASCDRRLVRLNNLIRIGKTNVHVDSANNV